MMRTAPVFEPRDLESMRHRGVRVEDVVDQLERIRHGSGRVHLLRAATIGDGIERSLGRDAELDQQGREAIAAGRCGCFVPASGAATRMFQDLIATLDQGIEIETETTRRLLDELPRFAFHDALASELQRRGLSAERLRAAGRARPILEALLEDDGLGYANAPKGMVLFHKAPEGPRTALEEHLFDAAAMMADGRGVARVHFTTAPEHEQRITDFIRERAATMSAGVGASFEVSVSTQGPESQCVAATPEGAPFRDTAGRLVFRPGGHGALLPNLEGTRGDLLFVRNVDNVPAAREAVHQWVPRMLGRLAEVERRTHEHLRRLDDSDDEGAVEAAVAFAATTFRRSPSPTEGEDAKSRARALLDRPIRVCGMVPNAGEPGGGPFWTRGADGSVSLQIVEQAQVGAEQRSILAGATHFNPVFMAVALRDRHGRPRDLRPFVDPEAVIVTRKSEGGRELLALERPGLWNGAMAHWNTLFLEVPLATFAPVKTIFDLLRPEHQPASDGAPRTRSSADQV
ncbi:MAG TPA: DUF4301 family protein [Candidatus Eisenbacteria bacterium]|nr:DUF4301 family protein [Candidatus Eisenbacteria bacterium]